MHPAAEPPVPRASLPTHVPSSFVSQPRSRSQKRRAATAHRSRAFIAAAARPAEKATAAGARRGGKPPASSLATPDSVKQLAERVRQRQGGGQPAGKRGSRPQQPPHARGGALSDGDLLAFERQGHLTTRALLQQQEVESLKTVLEAEVARRRLQALQHRARVLCSSCQKRLPRTIEEAERLLAAEGSEPVGFLQFFNTWRTNETVRKLVTAGALPRTAAALLGTQRLRVYQDCTFLKEPGHAQTNWHSDLRMAPFDSNALVTAWLPLRRVRARHDSGMAYASGSHRDFALPFWRQGRLDSLDLRARGYPLAGTGALELGDVAWHHGWTLHAAGAQPPGSPPRLALSVSYVADGARTLPRRLAGRVQDEDAESYAAWLGAVGPGALAAHELLPLVDLGAA